MTTTKPPLPHLGGDLLKINRFQLVRGLAGPFVLSASYWYFASITSWLLAVASLVVLSFLTYGSISHDLVHRSLGLPRWANDLLLCAIELLALRSGHAYRAIHLHHHLRYPHDDDIEAMAAKMSLLGAIVEGLFFVPRINLWAIRNAKTHRRWIIGECCCVVAFVVGATILLPLTNVPFTYMALMIAGSWIIPLVTSYIPHSPTGETEVLQTRVFRGLFFRVIAFDHLYHLEHHLYPAVPHYNWPRLASRIDPWLKENGVKPIKIGAR